MMASTLGHQTGYLYGYCLNFLLGTTAVWLDVWNVAAAAHVIEAERVTFTMGATPFLQDLTYVSTSHDLSSLRVFISAGASIPRQLVVDARAVALRDLSGLGNDRKWPGYLQWAIRSRRQDRRDRWRPLSRHGAAGPR